MNSLCCMLKPSFPSHHDAALSTMTGVNNTERADSGMKKSCLQLTLLFLLSTGFSVVAQQHIHGQGQLLISQDEKQWHVQLSLPVADALGFEHEPETEEQQSALNLLARRLEQNAEIVELNGQCALTKAEHSLAKQPENKHHDTHGHDEKQQHQDIEVEYQFNCKAAVTRVTLRLFDVMPSVTVIQTQWVSDGGQGLADLSRSHPYVEW